VKHVVGLLPDPLGKADPHGSAHDPCYDIELPESKLTDHFMDTRLNQEEIEINRKSKTDHSWYGRMAFPDPLDRPARTVMATQTGISRETLVIEWKNQGRSCYRRPTIRECASFQSFPISYQFWGSTAQTRYKLVGNAVPPLLASALARGILLKEGSAIPSIPVVSDSVTDFPPPVNLEHVFRAKRRHSYPENRKFRDHLPGSKAHGVRIDFANSITSPSGGDDESFEVRWEARLIAGSGKTVFVASPGLTFALSQLAIWSVINRESSRVDHLLATLDRDLRPTLPDAESLQEAWTERAAKSVTTPPLLLRSVARIVEETFPAADFGGAMAAVQPPFPSVGRDSIPLRALVQLVALSFVADAVNTGGRKETLQSLFESALNSGLASRYRKRNLVADAIS
jgi:DNA (cytosine-5)-methyltransferase 1